MAQVVIRWRDNVKVATACALAAALILPLSDALAKVLLERYSFSTIATIRFAVMACMVGALAATQSGPRILYPTAPGLQIARAGLAALALLLFFEGLRRLPLADCVAITFVHPVLTSIIAQLFLSERPRPDSWITLAISFAGVLFVMRPGSEVFSLYGLYPLGAGAALASYLVLTRYLGTKDDPRTTTFVTALLCAVGLAPFSLIGINPNDVTSNLLIFIGVGAFAGLGQLLVAYAYRCAPAHVVSPLGYLNVVVSVLLGWLCFGTIPDFFALCGIVVICLAGTFFTSRVM